MCLRRAALVFVPAVLLAASPALANRARSPHGRRLEGAGQVVTHGGTSPSANLARARAHQVRQEQRAQQGRRAQQEQRRAQQEQRRAQREQRARQERRARQQRRTYHPAAAHRRVAGEEHVRPQSPRDLLLQEIARARGYRSGLDRRSLIALTVGVPAIAGWIYAVSQWGDAILNFLR